MSNRFALLGPFLSYALLSLVFTYPLVTHLSTHVPGQLEGDVPVYIWNLWWMKHSLMEWHSPLFSDYIFAPYGVSLAFHAFVFLKAFMAVPLQAVTTAWTSYNLLILFTFTMAGFAMFLLARALTGDALAAWVAGMAYAFSPYMLTRGLGHLNYLSSEWMPLYILCLIKLVESAERRWALAGSAFLLLTAYCEYYYLIYMTLFTGLYLAWCWARRREQIFNSQFAQSFLLMGVLSALGFAPILSVLLGSGQGDYLYGGWGATAKLGADALAFVVPPPGSLLYGDIGAPLYEVFSGGNHIEGTVFVGFVALALVAFAAIRLRRDEAVRPWLWIGLAFFALSLGPLLHIGGDFVFGGGPLRVAVPLPYIGLRFVPLVKGARVPARFDIMVALCIAVLIAFALWRLRARWQHADRWTALVAVMLCLEYLRLPYPIAPVSVPSVYEEVARDPRDVAVLDVPLGWRTGWGDTGRTFDGQQLYQIVHGKRLVGGFASRVPEEELQRMLSMPGVGQLLALQEALPAPTAPTAARRGAIRAQLVELLDHLPEFARQRVLRDASVSNFLADTSAEQQRVQEAPRVGHLEQLVEEAGLGYVFLHPPYSASAPIRSYVEETLPVDKFYERGGLIGYRVVEGNR